MELYKVLDEKGRPCNGGIGDWYLPKGKRLGKWMPTIQGDLVPCENGYHACRRQDLVTWLGPTIWRLEYDGDMVETSDKVVVRLARLLSKVETWNKRTARLFAADCAERVLPLFEAKCPNDDRPRKAIQAARDFADGKIGKDELVAAGDVWDAAWDARDAAWAAGDAWAAWAAEDAARDAAGAAAEDTAGDAAGDARDAAWDARDAAWAAGDAAWAAGAAGAAARDAAGAAAEAAERRWQTDRLFEYLEGKRP